MAGLTKNFFNTFLIKLFSKKFYMSWLTSKRRLRFIQQYRTLPKEFYVYLVFVPQDSVVRIGRTSRFKYRVRYLKSSLYNPYEINVIKTNDGDENLAVERYLKKNLAYKNVSGTEWYRVTKYDILRLLSVSDDFKHLSISKPDEEPSSMKTVTMMKQEKPSFNIALS